MQQSPHRRRRPFSTITYDRTIKTEEIFSSTQRKAVVFIPAFLCVIHSISIQIPQPIHHGQRPAQILGHIQRPVAAARQRSFVHGFLHRRLIVAGHVTVTLSSDEFKFFESYSFIEFL